MQNVPTISSVFPDVIGTQTGAATPASSASAPGAAERVAQGNAAVADFATQLATVMDRAGLRATGAADEETQESTSPIVAAAVAPALQPPIGHTQLVAQGETSTGAPNCGMPATSSPVREGMAVILTPDGRDLPIPSRNTTPENLLPQDADGRSTLSGGAREITVRGTALMQEADTRHTAVKVAPQFGGASANLVSSTPVAEPEQGRPSAVAHQNRADGATRSIAPQATPGVVDVPRARSEELARIAMARFASHAESEAQEESSAVPRLSESLIVTGHEQTAPVQQAAISKSMAHVSAPSGMTPEQAVVQTFELVSMTGNDRKRHVVVEAPDTGRIEIDITRDGARLRVALLCARADVADGLQRHQQSLASDLQQTGAFASVQVDVGTSSEHGRPSKQGQTQGAPGHDPAAPEWDASAAISGALQEILSEWTGVEP